PSAATRACRGTPSPAAEGGHASWPGEAAVRGRRALGVAGRKRASCLRPRAGARAGARVQPGGCDRHGDDPCPLLRHHHPPPPCPRRPERPDAVVLGETKAAAALRARVASEVAARVAQVPVVLLETDDALAAVEADVVGLADAALVHIEGQPPATRPTGSQR